MMAPAMRLALLAATILLASPGAAVQHRSCTAPDGVKIAYSVAGASDTALVFIHGGLANRSFYEKQLEAFSDRYVVVALDLAGHGDSGTNRKTWSMTQFGADVKAVVDAEKLTRVVLFGNSLGGPVAIEAALLMPDRVLGVVGIDTFQDLGHPETPEYAQASAEFLRKRVESFRKDFAGSVKAMTRMLFHADADPALVADAERRMLRTSPETGVNILNSLAGYDTNTSARRLTVPLRAINGDLYPTDVARARAVKADFDVITMKHMGHYPMLERPDEFNRHVKTVVESLERRK